MKDYSFILEYIIPLEKWNLTDYTEYTHFYLKSYSNILMACIVTPHKDTDYRWLLRIANIDDFSKWINAQSETYYDDITDLINVLENIDTSKKLP